MNLERHGTLYFHRVAQRFPHIDQRVASPHLPRPHHAFKVLCAAAAVHCVPVSLYPLPLTRMHSADTHAFTRAEADIRLLHRPAPHRIVRAAYQAAPGRRWSAGEFGGDRQRCVS